jgi:hypothetical protein
MSRFDLDSTLRRARQRLGTGRPARKPRSDRGASRLDPGVLVILRDAVSGQERPRMRDLLAGLSERCRADGLAPPSRATVYRLLDRLPVPSYRVRDLPPEVRSALYNLEPDSEVPAHQLAFYCANYGGRRALSFAAGLPWLAIHQALRLPGFRPKSRGLLEAVAAVRRI